MVKKSLFIVVILGLLFSSCKKYLEVGSPSTQLSGSTVFNSDATAVAAQLAIYAQMESSGFSHLLLVNTGIASDEATNYSMSNDAIGFASNNLVPSNGTVYNIWTNLYKYIYLSNAVLKGINQSSSLSLPVKKQLEGEALFCRAFFHFYLVNLFGPVAYIRTTDHLQNAVAQRDGITTVYQSIIEDLIESKKLLASHYVSAANSETTERVRPNQYVAAAFLARVYLYIEQWALAIEEANFVISNSTTYSLTANPSGVFLKNSTESIWQLMSVIPKLNTYTGGYFMTSGVPSVMTLAPGIVSGFQTGDLRRSAWTKNVTSGSQSYVYPFKYQVGQNAPSITEYTMVLRLAELFLIRAEAKARLNDLTGGLSDLNKIRLRAGLPLADATDAAELVAAIDSERKYELFSEFGDRWLNIKRNGSADAIMSALRGNDWTSNDQLFPIPQTEIDRNPNLMQNPGY